MILPDIQPVNRIVIISVVLALTKGRKFCGETLPYFHTSLFPTIRVARVVLILTTKLDAPFVLPSFSLFSIFQLSSTVFAFSGLNTVGSFLTFSVLFLLLCYFNILLFMALSCVYSFKKVYTIMLASLKLR